MLAPPSKKPYNDHATRILSGLSDATAPVVRVSCAATLRDNMARNGMKAVFQPDAKRKNTPNAKAYLLGF
jgi:hypothetical protein